MSGRCGNSHLAFLFLQGLMTQRVSNKSQSVIVSHAS